MDRRDRLWWRIARLHPAVPEAPWLRTPAGDGRIGPDWPLRHSPGIALEADGGLIPDLGVLRDADRYHPSVRRFYEHTARFALGLQVRWTIGFRWVASLWARTYARRWGQFELPTHDAVDLTNEIWRADEGRWWVRRYAGTDRVLYVSRYDVIRVPSEPDPVVRIGFPLPGGAALVVFRVVTDGDALVLTEQGGRAGGAGLYLVPEGEPARYVRWLREEIRVSPAPTGCRAVHRMWIAGVPFLVLGYDLPA